VSGGKVAGAYFFDSSALVKRHVNEPGSAWVRSLTRARAGHTLFIARITAVEVFAAITRRQRGGSLSAAQAGAILGHFRRQLTQRYVIVEVTPPLLAAAMLSARKHGLRAYDAVQLAAAHEANRIYQMAGLAPVTLVSADRDLNAAATAERLLVEDPYAHP
jgi:predicted nucleic acid-binding protein